MVPLHSRVKIKLKKTKKMIRNLIITKCLSLYLKSIFDFTTAFCSTTLLFKVIDLLCKKNDRNLYFYDFVNFITKVSLREKCTNTEVFLVRIFLYSDWIRRFTGKKLRIWTLFDAVCIMVIIFLLKLEKTIPFLLSFFIITDFNSQVHWRRFE